MVRHTQATPAATWTITHNQGSPENSYPVVDVYIDIDNEQQLVIPELVTYVNAHTITVDFSEPQTGFATLVI